MKRTDLIALLGLLLMSAWVVPGASAQDNGPVSEIADSVDLSLNPGPASSPASTFVRTGTVDDYSDEQLEKINKVRTDYMNKASSRMLELRTQQQALQGLLGQPDFDMNKARSIQEKINGLHDELSNLSLDQQVAMRACLTPEQRKAWRRNGSGFTGGGYGTALSGCPFPGSGFGLGRGYCGGFGGGRGYGGGRGFGGPGGGSGGGRGYGGGRGFGGPGGGSGGGRGFGGPGYGGGGFGCPFGWN
jgi:hypothetical protein